MNKKFDVGDKKWIANVINQFENVNLMMLDEKQVRRMLVDAFVEGLPQIVAHPEFVSHIRNVTRNSLEAARENESRSQADQIARRIWSEAEPEVTSAVASLVAESEKSVMRALTRVTPEFTMTRVDIEPYSNERWEFYLEQGEVMEYRPANRSGMAAVSISVIGPDCRWSTIMSVVNRSGKMSVHERIDIDPERTGKAPSA